MKVYLFMAGLLLLFAACTHSQQVTNFIPGIYANHAESAYSVADDTLIVTGENGNANNYHIIRRTTFWRKEGNKKQPPQHKIKNYTAVWDNSKQVLQITQNGGLLLFRPDENKLLMENSEYRKL
ncbi:MAG: hypothetical protein ABIN91_25035 [Mucilaginibacter sp.]|uniref:hypothetical protein n=1 Tax=Mucilaginibacter sp. TaxID=1882438 RepID=UPI0032633A34